MGIRQNQRVKYLLGLHKVRYTSLLFKAFAMPRHVCIVTMKSSTSSPEFRIDTRNAIPRARDSGSHEDSMRSTGRHSGASSSSLVSKAPTDTHDESFSSCQKADVLELKIEKLSKHIETLQIKIDMLTMESERHSQERITLIEMIQSLESQIEKKSVIEALRMQDEVSRQMEYRDRIRELESLLEASKLCSKNHKHELLMLAEVFNDRKAVMEAAHQTEICDLQAKHDALEADLRYSSRRCLQYYRHSSDLCQLIDSLNIYIGELENKFSELLRMKSSELELANKNYTEALENLRSHGSRCDLFQAGIRRAAAFLAELSEK